MSQLEALLGLQTEPIEEEPDVIVVSESEGEDALDTTPVLNDNGTIEISLPDGGVMIDLNPRRSAAEQRESSHDENLAEKLPEHVLSMIAGDLYDGIQADDRSRAEWIEQRDNGITLLGLRRESPKSGDSASGAPLDGMSTVRDPILLEAIIRFMSNASSELLPANGPVKVRNDGAGDGIGDELAETLEKDMNAYLTTTASEYYPDTKRMLLMTGFGGSGFKKVYHCPLRNRPVSDAIDAKDLIVSNAAVDLASAGRVTHQVRMSRSNMIRMKILGEYRDVELSDPVLTPNAVETTMAQVAGVRISAERPEDQNYELYESYCELDIEGYEHKVNGEPTGLPLPYIVTMDKTSQEILSIRRNWPEQEEGQEDDLPVANDVFVEYCYIRGFGLYGIGLLHVLGNIATALTATTREMIDAGMLANFPGFLYLQNASNKQMTNHFRVPPGGGAPIQSNGQQPIQDMVMPLPYKEPGPAFMQFMGALREIGQRVGNMAEIAVGEGKQNAPVGTTLALLDVATKVEGAVHKDLHVSQSKELRLLKELFRQDPEALWRNSKRKMGKWNADKLRAALENYELVPQADPNTPSHMHRLMKSMGLLQLEAAKPNLYNAKAVHERVLKMIGIDSPDELFAPPQAAQPDPTVKLLEDKNQIDREKIASNDRNKELDRAINLAIEKLKVAARLAENPESQPIVEEAIRLIPVPMSQPGGFGPH